MREFNESKGKSLHWWTGEKSDPILKSFVFTGTVTLVLLWLFFDFLFFNFHNQLVI